jgi:hypothetical protein
MPLRPQLLAEIQQVLGPSLVPSLTSASAANDIYEAYLFSLICEAAITEGATVAFRSRTQPSPASFVFRTSPGYINSTTHDYGYAIIEFSNKPLLEAHVGVRVTGASMVLHECDVSVLLQDEADLCRNATTNVAPRAAKIIISVEAKFYDSSLGLYLGRAFLGFTMDVSAFKAFFVINRTSRSIEKLLSHKKRAWEHNIQPQNTTDVVRLRNAFQTAFKDFKAKY